MGKLTNSFLLMLSIMLSLTTFADGQAGGIIGTVVDEEFAEPVTGASVVIPALEQRAVTDAEGKFYFKNVPDGTYNLEVTFFGYPKVVVNSIQVRRGQTVTQNVNLRGQADEIGETVIEVTPTQASEAVVLLQRAQAEQISDAISADAIKRTPDNSSSDVIKRIPGASIQDNRFAIIRGLNDRYNAAYINGAPLPSTESDRRAFSFDLFPSNMLDNMVILKTATPDMPAEFAGGMIQLNTKDIPDGDFLSVGASVGTNSLLGLDPVSRGLNSVYSAVSGKDEHAKNIFLASEQGPTNFFLKDELKNRAMPAEAGDQIGALETKSNEDKVAISRMFPNSYGIQSINSAIPSYSLNAAYGRSFQLGEKQRLGFTASLSNSHSYSYTPLEINNFQITRDPGAEVVRANEQRSHFVDDIYSTERNLGALLNLGYNVGKSSFFFKNAYTVSAESEYRFREAYRDLIIYDNRIEQEVHTYTYKQNNLLTSQLGAEHKLVNDAVKIDWLGGYSNIKRNLPDQHSASFNRSLTDSTLSPAVSPSPTDANRRFYSDLDENIYSGGVNASAMLIGSKGLLTKGSTLPVADPQLKLKVGAFQQERNRDYNARFFGYAWTDRRKFSFADRDVSTPEKLFANDILNPYFRLGEIANPAFEYDAASSLAAQYAMVDLNAGMVRLVAGARREDFQQQLTTADPVSTIEEPTVVDVNFRNVNVLPSFNLTVSLTEKSKIRASQYQTVTRPEFRELAPFEFYDFNLNASVAGNRDLRPGTVQNYDLRYEYYLGGPQIVSASVFYKEFTNPVEQIISVTNTGTDRFGYINVPRATSYGVEFEFKKNMSFLDSAMGSDFWTYITAFANVALIKSTVDLTSFGDQASYNISGKRSLQGQSPYVINTGIYGSWEKWSASVAVNRVGRRIIYVGNLGIPDIYEKPRTVLDFQLARSVTEQLSIKLALSDVLAQDLIFYQDIDADDRFTDVEGGTSLKTIAEGGKADLTDNIIYRYKRPFRMSLGVSYSFR